MATGAAAAEAAEAVDAPPVALYEEDGETGQLSGDEGDDAAGARVLYAEGELEDEVLESEGEEDAPTQ